MSPCSVVLGAGVVGLAVARALARSGRDVLVLEATKAIGTGVSSRNSEVVHAGIYYPKGSLKAMLCVEGRKMLYDFCGEFGVEYRRTGKLIVATGDDQREQLAALHGKALANGVDDLELLGPEAVVEMEPELRCAAALHSPSTGIVDSHGLMVALQGDAEAHGAWVVVDSPVTGGGVNRDGTFRVVTADMELSCTELINCTGLSAPAVALSIGTPADHVPVPYFAKGNYYRLEGRSPFKRLIYPVPESAGLGVHATIDLGGQVRFGPDVEWVDGSV